MVRMECRLFAAAGLVAVGPHLRPQQTAFAGNLSGHVPDQLL